jgi:hypothetical protein
LKGGFLAGSPSDATANHAAAGFPGADTLARYIVGDGLTRSDTEFATVGFGKKMVCGFALEVD